MTRSFLSKMARASVLAVLALGTLCAVGCGDDDGPGDSPCRYHPQSCGGDLGGNCDRNGDCGSGFCCKAPKECGGGMCTYECRGDYDCPRDMGCEHGVCFLLCYSDNDCAVGQTCGHDHSVCEWK